MKVTKLKILRFGLFCYFLNFCSCEKVESIQMLCKNPVANDLKFRLGTWTQVPVRKPSLRKINFISDNTIDIYSDGIQGWIRNVKYKFDTCDKFSYYKYWLAQPPNSIEYDFWISKYDSTNQEWLLIKHDYYSTPIMYDTCRFKKI